MRINRTTFSIIHGDITTLKVDAVVNAAHPHLRMNEGLAAVIKKKGGDVIEEQAMGKSPIEPGEAIWTNAGKIKAKYIIHTATVNSYSKTDQDILRAAVAHTLKVANELKIKSLAFPALGCGIGQFPPMGAAKIMVQEILKIIKLPENTVEDITFCVFDEKIFNVFSKTVYGYLDHIQKKLGPGPYITVDMIIEYQGGIVLIERSNPPYGWSLPGGFLDYGESLEVAAMREAKEETNLELKNLKQFHTYSEPGRDPRFHTVSTVFTAEGSGEARSGSDAANLQIIRHGELLNREYAFDHKKVLADYLQAKKKHGA